MDSKKNYKRNLYIDFDGVILDTMRVTYDMLDRLNVDKTDGDKMLEFFSNLNWKHILNVSPIINESLKCIQKILDSQKFEIAILTHVNSLDEAVHKINYIRRYFKDITIIIVPKQISKTKMIHTKNNILIDDYSANLEEWQKEEGLPVLFSRELENKGFPVINKLDQIIDMF